MGQIGLQIRTATDDERQKCLRQWARSLTRVHAASDGVMWARCGRGRCNAPLLRDALNIKLASMHRMAVDVVVIDDGPPLGFVAHEPGTLHFVHVDGEARRKGLGTMLFRHAVVGEYVPTFMTESGRALEQCALRLIAAERGAA